MKSQMHNTRVSQILLSKSTKLWDGEERKEMLLKLSDLSLGLNLSLEWSTKLRE